LGTLTDPFLLHYFDNWADVMTLLKTPDVVSNFGLLDDGDSNYQLLLKTVSLAEKTANGKF